MKRFIIVAMLFSCYAAYSQQPTLSQLNGSLTVISSALGGTADAQVSGLFNDARGVYDWTQIQTGNRWIFTDANCNRWRIDGNSSSGGTVNIDVTDLDGVGTAPASGLGVITHETPNKGYPVFVTNPNISATLEACMLTHFSLMVDLSGGSDADSITSVTFTNDTTLRISNVSGVSFDAVVPDIDEVGADNGLSIGRNEGRKEIVYLGGTLIQDTEVTLNGNKIEFDQGDGLSNLATLSLDPTSGGQPNNPFFQVSLGDYTLGNPGNGTSFRADTTGFDVISGSGNSRSSELYVEDIIQLRTATDIGGARTSNFIMGGDSVLFSSGIIDGNTPNYVGSQNFFRQSQDTTIILANNFRFINPQIEAGTAKIGDVLQLSALDGSMVLGSSSEIGHNFAVDTVDHTGHSFVEGDGVTKSSNTEYGATDPNQVPDGFILDVLGPNQYVVMFSGEVAIDALSLSARTAWNAKAEGIWYFTAGGVSQTADDYWRPLTKKSFGSIFAINNIGVQNGSGSQGGGGALVNLFDLNDTLNTARNHLINGADFKMTDLQGWTFGYDGTLFGGQGWTLAKDLGGGDFNGFVAYENGLGDATIIGRTTSSAFVIGMHQQNTDVRFGHETNSVNGEFFHFDGDDIIVKGLKKHPNTAAGVADATIASDGMFLVDNGDGSHSLHVKN